MEEQNTKTFPFKIQDVEPEVAAELMKYFTGDHNGYVRVGPKGYFFPKEYESDAANIYNMSIRPSDIFVITGPRSGTTWASELVWLIANDLDFARTEEIGMGVKFPFTECPAFIPQSLLDMNVTAIASHYKINKEEIPKVLTTFGQSLTGVISQMPSPRFIKSHLPLSFLPPSLLDTAKVVYVARDLRDVAVSFYHHNRLFKHHGFVGDFKTYWNFFINGLVYYMPIMEAIKEAWAKRDHPNMLFLFYEELSKDLPSVIRRVAAFLDKQLTEPQIEQLCEHLNIEKFKTNKSINLEKSSLLVYPNEEPFIRKGKVGGWRDYFDAQMTEQAERWIEDNLRDTDLRFPE